MSNLRFAIGLSLFVAASGCEEPPPAVPVPSGTTAQAEPAPPEGKIDRANRELKELKQGMQETHDAREQNLDQKMGQQ